MSDFGSLEAEPRRDRYKRYLIMPEGGGKDLAMTRATTVSGILDDRYNIEKWQQRHVALGLAQRGDLLAAIQTADVDDKSTINQICKLAMDASGSDSAARMGTAIHAVVEAVNLNPDVEVPEAFAERIVEYRRVMDEFGVEVVRDCVERVHVLATHGIAGMADAHVIIGGRRYILDLKTGSSVDYGAGGYAVQLAIYANSTSIYQLDVDAEWRAYIGAALEAISEASDVVNGTIDLKSFWRDEMEGVPTPSKADTWTFEQIVKVGSKFIPNIKPPTCSPHEVMPADLDRERAVILHLPAKGGEATLKWIDITAGREALEHAYYAHGWRKRRDLLTPFDVPEVPNAEPPALEVVRDELQPRRERLLAALRPLKDADAATFVATWRRALADVAFPNKADEWDAAAMDAVERAYELSWTDDVVPTVAPENTMPEPRPETEAEDHGGLIDPESLAEAREQIAHLPRGAKGWMIAWQDEAVAAGLSWRMGRGAHVSQRSWWTTKAGYWLARLVHGSDADDPLDDARLVLASVLGDAALMPTITVGKCLSALTLDEASMCCSLAQCAVEGDVRINDKGLLEVAA